MRAFTLLYRSDLAFKVINRTGAYRWPARIGLWLGHRTPARLKYWVLIDVLAWASTGPLADTAVPDIKAVDVFLHFSAAHDLDGPAS